MFLRDVVIFMLAVLYRDINSNEAQPHLHARTTVIIASTSQVIRLYLYIFCILRMRLRQQVPGLYKPEELEPLLLPLRDQAAHEGYRGSYMTYFSEREYGRQ